MAEKPGGHGAKEVAAVDALLALQQRNIDAMNGAVKLALESMQAIANRHGDFVSEAHHQLALLLWRNALPPTLDGTPTLSLEIAKRVIDTSLAQAVTVTELAAKLQRQGLTMFGRSVCDCLSLLDGPPRTGDPHRAGS